MGKFVREQPHEKQDSGDDRGTPNDCIAPFGMNAVEVTSQRKRDQHSNHQPAIVQPEFYTENTRQSDLCSHLVLAGKLTSPDALRRSRDSFTGRYTAFERFFE